MTPLPLLAGSTKLPTNVAPAASRIVSPGFALLSADCKSPPAGTLMTPDCTTGDGDAGPTVIVETLNPPVSNTSFISCVPAVSVAGTEIVVYVCHAPVLGTAILAVLEPLKVTCTDPLVYDDATLSW